MRYLTFILSVVLLLNMLSAQAQEKIDPPYSSHWFIHELLQWSPDTDPNAPFNVSTTPLAKKFLQPKFQMNKHAHANQAKVNILPIFGNTSGNPSQGSLDSSYYAFTYWQYVDVLVFWGGSSAEGIILSPNPGVIDAAHRHGVPVYGTVFFPPKVYGGKREWVYDFVKKENGRFPVADKLIEVANYYGFDGWFINQETGNEGKAKADSELAGAMREFMIYYKRNSKLDLEWYDAMRENGVVNWQHELNETNDMFFQYGDTLVSDFLFLDFRSRKQHLANTNKFAKKLKRNVYDIFASIDTQNGGYDAEPGYRYPAGANFDVIFPEGEPHAASLGIYVPSWTHHSSKSITEFHKKENRFWVGDHGNPRVTETKHNWKGIAHYVPAKSTIQATSFVTNFCTGQGKKYFRKGVDVTSSTWNTGWNNLALQALQPTWRWVVDAKGGTLDVDYDYTDAYNAGNSLRMKGDVKKATVKLFSTKLVVSEGMQLRVANKQTEGELGVILHFSNGRKKYFPLQNNTKTWQYNVVTLDKFRGKTIECISLIGKANKKQQVDLSVGQLGIVGRTSLVVSAPSKIRITEKNIGKNKGSLKLTFNSEAKSVFSHSVFQVHKNGSRTFLGATTAKALYLPLFEIEKSATKVDFEIITTNNDFEESKPILFSIKL